MSLLALEGHDEFPARHIGPGAEDRAQMLDALGYASLADLVDAAVPDSIRDASAAVGPDATGTAASVSSSRLE